MAVEPPPTRWHFPAAAPIDEHGLVGVGADLAPGTVLAAYRTGSFPMPIDDGGPIGWWSPDPRGVLDPSTVHVSRSLRRSLPTFEIRIDTAFDDVIAGCADPRRPHGWIDARMQAAYRELHTLGWAHSVETWFEGELVGGLYGLALGGLFAAESKFHRRTDASKAAVVALCELLDDGAGRLIDVQWRTDHLARLGVVELPRAVYLDRLVTLLARPLPEPWAGRDLRSAQPLA